MHDCRRRGLPRSRDEDLRFPAGHPFGRGGIRSGGMRDRGAGLEVIRNRPDDVALILTDVQLPGTMDGIEFTKTVHAELPHVRHRHLRRSGDRISELPSGVPSEAVAGVGSPARATCANAGLLVFRMFVTGAPPNWGGHGIPHRAMHSSRRPAGAFRTTGAM
jgi:hypothetical protein